MGEYGKVWMGFHPKFYLTYHFFIIKKRKKIKKKIKWICTAWLCTSQNCPYQFIKSYSEDSTLWNDNINREHRAWLYIAQQEASVWAAGEIIINNNKQLSCVRLFVTPWTVSPWNAPGQNTGVGSLSLLQGIFPTEGSNPGLLHCSQGWADCACFYGDPTPIPTPGAGVLWAASSNLSTERDLEGRATIRNSISS